MISEKPQRNWFVLVFVWLMLIGLCVAGAKFFLLPFMSSRLEKQTGSESQYSNGEIICAADEFKGYAVIRSDEFIERQKARGVRFTVQDDQADTEKRLKRLRDGEIQMAVFTIDSYIKASALAKEFPGSIVMIIDESIGADGFGAYEEAISSLQDLNNPEVKVVLTQNSPTEFYARILMSHLTVNIPESKWIGVAGSRDVFKLLKNADPKEKKIYGMWESELSQAKKISGFKIIIDSSKIKGYIIDVLIINRKFLKEHPDKCQNVIEDYQRTLYTYQSQNRLSELVILDAKKFGENLTKELADEVVKGIRWKNTLENYAHFGLLSRQEARGLQSLEDSIANISKVLVETGSLKENPTAGKENTLFYNQILSKMKDTNFHPGRAVQILSNEAGLKLDLDEIREKKKLAPLTDSQWEQLVPVADMRVPPINFGRGKSVITIQGQRDLNELLKNLLAWDFYLNVIGNASDEGDRNANLELAKSRSEAVVEYLLSGGIEESRIKATTAIPFGNSASSRTVEFRLGQKPF